MGHEEGFSGRAAGVKRGESSKDERRSGEGGSIETDAEELVNSCQTSRRALDAVVCRSQTVEILIPRRRAGEEHLNDNASQIHVSESAGKDG